ncbi:MAG: flagellar export protein FliJ [Lachnospiraceae bacterium]|nr:flagellar export protein FliJ [Lachnospiraceae bacterium]
MAKFVYRMQNILDIKQKLESQAKITYGLAAQRFAEEQQKLQELMIRRMRYEKALRQMMEGPLNLKEIHNAKSDVTMIKTLVRAQTIKTRRAEAQMNDARRALNEVMQERKIQEKLKEKAFEEFKREIAAQEAKEIDELVSYTYNGN